MSEYQKGEVLWKVSMAAKYLCMHPKTLYKNIRLGKLFRPERIVRIGEDIRIPRDEVFRVAEGIKGKIYTNAEHNAHPR